MKKLLAEIKVAEYASFAEAKSKATELREKLNGENPILAVFVADSYAHINRVITWPVLLPLFL